MKTTRITLAVLCASLLVAAGCKNQNQGPISPPLVRIGVYAGASYGMVKYPEALPGVRGAAAVICAQAAGTNVSPAQVVSAVQAYTVLDRESKMIITGALAIYTMLWNSYGTNSVLMGQYLTATCDGLNDALVLNQTTPTEKAMRQKLTNNWPQVE